jgi:sugar phosphate permease
VSPFGGFVSLGFNTSLLNGVLGATPDNDRLVYMAFFNTAQNLSLFLAPLFAHMVLSVIGVKETFYVLAGMRLLASGILFLLGKRRGAFKPTA